jgi:hypothetical protein
MTYLPLRRLEIVPDPPLNPPALSPGEETQAEEWGQEIAIIIDLEAAVVAMIDLLPMTTEEFKYRRFLSPLEELRQELETDRHALEHKLQWGDD